MLEFVTVLPQECEDAANAAQSGCAEEVFKLKQRVSRPVGWLVSPAGTLPGMQNPWRCG